MFFWNFKFLKAAFCVGPLQTILMGTVIAPRPALGNCLIFGTFTTSFFCLVFSDDSTLSILGNTKAGVKYLPQSVARNLPKCCQMSCQTFLLNWTLYIKLNELNFELPVNVFREYV